MDFKRKSSPTQTLVDSDDDEPIGVLLKKKSTKIFKKAKLIEDGGESLAKGLEKMTPEKDEHAGMDDTLAIFRQKLRGPKNKVGCDIAVGKKMSINGMEAPCQFIDEPIGKDTQLLDDGPKKNSSAGSESPVRISKSDSSSKDAKTEDSTLPTAGEMSPSSLRTCPVDISLEMDMDLDLSTRIQIQRPSRDHAGNGKAAAVAAGLKARAAGPLEKIKFKEVLKHKGGLQEYLECRNHILSVWNKDVNRILLLEDFGVSEAPLAGESKRDSLIRDIFTFLDQCGCINFGVLSGRENMDSCLKPDAELPTEERHRINSAGTEDLNTIPPSKDENHKTTTDAQPDLLSPEQAVRGRLSDSMDEPFSHAQYDSKPKRNIIVIGAGPAGLTAARHLQRQGFSVTVLEARSRVGGRVFTDRSSLSVPVDLGASIITGVEADVATERRPDPSSLICAQLGLELTVLNSECPLYDTVTGEKVPADLDEELEAEYNGLLDDMEILVAEKGDHAMKMSLEEGLECGLKRRRMAQSDRDDMKTIPVKSREASGLSPLERRVMDWHFAHLEYGCAALLQEVSLPNWNQDDVYGGFGGAHCMIKGGYSAVVESLAEGICIHLDHVVTDITYHTRDCDADDKLHRKVKVSTSNGKEFSGDAVLVTVSLGCLKAENIKFSPPLPQWKHLSIKRLGFGVLNKVVLEFPDVFWDDAIDYFGATAEDRDQRGRCFMFWNISKTVGAPVLIALVVGKAAIDDQSTSSSGNVSHALLVLRKLFGEDKVSDPVAAVVTDWGRDPYSYGAYSYVAVGSSGEDYDILGRPVENCLFFAGEATCKEHPDTVGGAMMSGLREAVRIIDIMNTGTDHIAEVEAMEAARRHSDIEMSEVKDIIRRLDAVEFSSALYRKSSEGSRVSSWGSMLKDMFFTAKTTAGRLHLAKELLSIPVGFLKTFASTKEGLSTLNTWILDSMGKDGTQLLRHCVRLLVLVSNDLAAVRLSGVGKTVKQKVCVHTSRDIRAIAFQLVRVWVELFRKEKAAKGGLKLLRQSNSLDSKSKSPLASGKPRHSNASSTAGHQLQSNTSDRKMDDSPIKLEAKILLNMEEDGLEVPMSEEEKAAFAAAEAARAAAIAAARALAASGARNASLQAPKILSFHKFAMRGQNTHMDEPDSRKHWPGASIGRQECLPETDSRNCRVVDWSADFSAAGGHLDTSRISVDNCSQKAHSNSISASRQSNFREHSGENIAVDSSFLTKAWVDSAGSEGIKDYSAIERWQCQAAAAASSGFTHGTMQMRDEEESNVSSRKHEARANERSTISQVTMNKVSKGGQPTGSDRLKKAVVDYVASLLMPLYNAKKVDRDGYKSIMKKAATKVMEQTTDAEKAMAVHEFLDFKRKNKIRAFVDVLIERHKAVKPDAKAGSSEKD
ncbi:Lysine-specific histone demethylase 1 homolog 3 [Striga hermonthica]|uniref:Lysine-specific histone demethylase 1 homolog 3 n=1 Tax=Striga hermonthica TaxID=68872 RepID=A0A9N7NRB5_STRHE|nr:Lysine-specific histone demethylase 1 homolog 3 [Striga hermonthica]